MTFDLDRYLDRIAHRPGAATPEALAALQAAQLTAIPFENTEPYLGKVPDLDPAAIWKKLVVDGHGGYCFELNTLFGMALAALGYRAVPVLGRVRMGAATGGPRAHLSYVVTIGERSFLADAGFGGSAPEAPLELGQSGPQEDRLGRYRLRADTATEETVMERETPEGWFALYGFDRSPVTPPDYVAANFFCARFPQSPFPNHLMLHRVTANGRVSLFDRRFTSDAKEREIVSEADLASVLRKEFRIAADDRTVAAVWKRLQPEMMDCVS